MMEDELKALLREHGWNMLKRKRREREYYYAQKWKRDYVYICPTTKLSMITKEQVLEKLAKAEAS